jgi:hypothetical protein
VPPIVQCGSADGGNYYNSTEITPNTLCGDGLVRSVTTLGSQFSWSCDTGVSCSAYVKKDGACDNATLFACSNDTISMTNSGGTC